MTPFGQAAMAAVGFDAAPLRAEDEERAAEELAAEEPRVGFIGPLERHHARRWALVLQSQSIAFAMLPTLEGWLLRVAAADLDRAVEHIDLYEAENHGWPPREEPDTPRHPPSPLMALAFLAMVAFFFSVTGPASRHSVWFAEGTADARLLFGEPWRMVTALTLHGDGSHVLGNAISGTIFASMVGRRLGPGAALLSVVAAGALGNAANALYYLLRLDQGHRSIGASTAVFAAVGLLAAVQLGLLIHRRHRPRRRRLRWLDLVAPIAGGLTLLGTLGSSPTSDLGAHGFGFAAGVALGALAVPFVARDDTKPSTALQWALGLTGAALLWGSWALALLA